jgi:hypothetical protein
MTLSDEEYQAALARGRRREQREFVATAVRYDAGRDVVIVSLSGGFVVEAPRSRIEALRDVSQEALHRLALSPAGTGIDLDEVDVAISIDGVIRLLTPDDVVRTWAAQLMGRTTSDAKRAAARRNGAKGGRPRKVAP